MTIHSGEPISINPVRVLDCINMVDATASGRCAEAGKIWALLEDDHELRAMYLHAICAELVMRCADGPEMLNRLPREMMADLDEGG
jgi:hypothetical protein